MQNAALVRVVNRLRNDSHIARRAANPFRIPHFAFRIHSRQALALDEIHREKRLSLVRANFVDGYDVRVLQTGRRCRFCPKPLRQILPRLVAEQEHLHRDNAAKAPLPRLVNNTHPATCDFFNQFVIAEGERTPSPLNGERAGVRGEMGGRSQRRLFHLLASQL